MNEIIYLFKVQNIMYSIVLSLEKRYLLTLMDSYKRRINFTKIALL